MEAQLKDQAARNKAAEEELAALRAKSTESENVFVEKLAKERQEKGSDRLKKMEEMMMVVMASQQTVKENQQAVMT